MNYQLMRAGDRYPAVGVLQKLLNRSGESLVVDGDFGSKTREAVKRFQRGHGLKADGIVGKDTFPQLIEGYAGEDELHIVDCIDVFDENFWTDGQQWEDQDIRGAGGRPILLGGMSNGIEQAISDICRAAAAGSVFLLRFHGHGTGGVAGISLGTGEVVGEGSYLTPDSADQYAASLARLKPLFSPYGCVQLMHCSTGAGAQGRLLLKKLARAIGVPVTAALLIQRGGSGVNTFAWEGPTQTAFPDGKSLKEWCKKLPDFAAMSLR
ncbi:MAG: peptidoglycan-binding protein [Planctomycetia bacterium]|nr:peptidoglycan-binding protein [Planctomycetia bacterium]